MIIGPIKYDITGEWKKRKNRGLQEMFNKIYIVEMIVKRRLRWAGSSMCSQNSLLRTVLEQNLVGKRSLGRPKLRCEDIVKKGLYEN